MKPDYLGGNVGTSIKNVYNLKLFDRILTKNNF